MHTSPNFLRVLSTLAFAACASAFGATANVSPKAPFVRLQRWLFRTEVLSNKPGHADGEAALRRELSPLQKALLNDPPQGRFVSDGWTEEQEADMISSDKFFDSLSDTSTAPMLTFVDKFLAIDE